MNNHTARHVCNWWARTKIAAEDWKDRAQAMNIPQEVIKWSERATGGRAGQLWFAILANKNLAEIVPGEDDEQVAALIDDFIAYKDMLSKKRLELYESKSEFVQEVEKIKKILLPEQSSWRATEGKDMHPMVVKRTTGGDLYEVILIERKDCQRLLSTRYCVARGHTYNPDRYFLVVKNGKVFSLVHPESRQNKNAEDIELEGCDEAIAASMVSRVMKNHNEYLSQEVERGLAQCKSGGMGALYEIVSDTNPKSIENAMEKNPAFLTFMMMAKHEGKLSVSDDSPVSITIKKNVERMRTDGTLISSMLRMISPHPHHHYTTDLDLQAFINIFMFLYRDATSRKDKNMLNIIKESIATMRWADAGTSQSYDLSNKKPNKSIRHKKWGDIKPQLFKDFHEALIALGLKNLSDPLHDMAHRNLATYHLRSKQKIDEGLTDEFLASGNIPLILNYYLHGAHRGTTISNQMPNSGKPWPALEKLAVDMCMSNPSGSYTILRMYLPAVADPLDRLKEMIRMASESSREGIKDAFDLVVPKDWKKLLAAQA